MRNETVANNVPKTTIHAHVADKRDTVGVIASTHYHDELELLPIFEGEFVAVVDGTEYKADKIIFAVLSFSRLRHRPNI